MTAFPDADLTMPQPRRSAWRSGDVPAAPVEFGRSRLWDRLRATGAVSTMRRARQVPVSRLDCLAFVAAMFAIGVVLVAHQRGWW